MKQLHFFIILLCISFFSISSCASEEEKQAARERIEKAKIEKEKRLAEEERQKELYAMYINNSLRTGATPYENCFGKNKRCTKIGCSEIKVRTPNNSDVLVTIKRNNYVIKHAFIKAASHYTFEMPNGTYQPFFYYGKGWNPNKSMNSVSCSSLVGGFISNESFSKDDPQLLNNNILEYTLVLQEMGNFRTKPSSENEAF